LGSARRALALLLAAALTIFAGPAASEDDSSAPVAGAFVYPVGDELDFTKAHAGEPGGFYISDSYLVRRGRKKQRTHLGVDLANGRGGATVRSIASGVVVVADANALVKVRRKQSLKLPAIVDGKRVYKTATRWRSTWKWRTGWGNYVVVRHTMPDGETVRSLYGHLASKSVVVKKGDVIAAGQPLGKVGRTGRATSAHLHLEIRKSLPASPEEEMEEEGDQEDATAEDRSFAKLQTVDPTAFLEQHVRRFEDLEPGTWEARYALAACRDGILAGDGDRFDPDRSITRGDYYRALVTAFRLGTPFTTNVYSSSVDALVDSDILDTGSSRSRGASDRLTRSEALELLLRCLDKKPGHGRNLSGIETEHLCRDFNRQFAGDEAAQRADLEARETAARETMARIQAAEAEYTRALKAAKAAKAKGAGAVAHATVKRRTVKPVQPVPRLDAGFEELARSTKNLSRAESCLLIASALRLSPTQLSALERAAARVAASASG
jgi:murein DD-endopeptidase MepM/ murein hydrolase activator NlpD